MWDAQARCYSQEVREALRRSQELERPRGSPRGIPSALGLGEQPNGEARAPPWGLEPVVVDMDARVCCLSQADKLISL